MQNPVADVPPFTTDLTGPPSVAATGGRACRRFTSLFTRAGQRAFWPLADQGVASLGNILTIFLVGRGMAQADFGTFTLVLEAMLFLMSMHASLITYPLTVKGAVSDGRTLRQLSTSALVLTLLLAVPLSIAALAVAGFYHMLAVGFMATAALVCWQMQESVRRALLSQFRHAQAIWGDSFSYLGQAACLLFLNHIGRLTLLTTFASIGFTSAIALVIQAAQVGVNGIRLGELFDLAKAFWIAGRWIALTNLSGLCLMACGNWALGWSHGREQVADFAAIVALLKICNPILQTIAGLIVPSAAKALAAGGMAAARRTSFKIAAMAALLLAPLFFVLAAAPRWCLSIAFHGRYNGPEHQLALRVLVTGNIVVFLITAVTSFLNGIHRTRLTFYGQLAGSIAMFAILLPMNIAYGWMGYVIGGLLQVLVQLLVLLWLLRKVR